MAEGDVSVIGQLLVDKHQSKMVKILSSVNPEAYHEEFANMLGEQKQSAVVASFVEENMVIGCPGPSRGSGFSLDLSMGSLQTTSSRPLIHSNDNLFFCPADDAFG